MTAPSLNNSVWRKSTYSTAESDCVEVAWADWRKSSRSSGEANCIEVGFTAGTVAIRDTKDRDGGMLTVAGASWVAFLRSQR